MLDTYINAINNITAEGKVPPSLLKLHYRGSKNKQGLSQIIHWIPSCARTPRE